MQDIYGRALRNNICEEVGEAGMGRRVKQNLSCDALSNKGLSKSIDRYWGQGKPSELS